MYNILNNYCISVFSRNNLFKVIVRRNAIITWSRGAQANYHAVDSRGLAPNKEKKKLISAI